ncbi:hypothetical protein FB45DRAFT_359164 [Roridomyces roridus]|uniref:Uncharacterized protein n=1 Tax=Roridomyces roridus TaxID=1738132 RepID=A0AAD7FWB5_9AGAR|nr:hypothetical protein FB45DRAFT_359164 [Roridomyces roridus]
MRTNRSSAWPFSESVSRALRLLFPNPSGRADRSYIYKDWFTTRNPPWEWSTDWENWGGLGLFQPPDEMDFEEKILSQPWDTLIQGILAEEFGITDLAEPILFLPGCGGHWFLFAAGSKYYWYNDGFVGRYKWEYKDKNDFVTRFREEERTEGFEELESFKDKEGTLNH